MKEIAEKYFAAWSSNNVENLRPLFTDDITIQDWETNVSGIKNVIAFNQDIFNKFPGIHIIVKDIGVSETQALCEIDIVIGQGRALKIANVITIVNGKIKAVKAFKR